MRSSRHRRRRRWGVILACLGPVAWACTTDATQAVTGGATESSSADDAATDSPPGDDDTGTATSSTPDCGNGIVEVGEECDEGPDNGSSSCSETCERYICGDGTVDPGEQCDNGPDNGPGQLCNASCWDNVCGDGDRGPHEACDDGNLGDGDGCSADCKLESCGDAVVDDLEDCDDGNRDNDDGCTEHCTAPVCGDGFTQPSQGETCDDGADNGNDAACTANCQMAYCGDGLVWEGQETCDDGNDDNFDACPNDCREAECGDGVVEATEDCEAGMGGGVDCTDLGYDGGQLSCKQCKFDETGCTRCDGVQLEPGEVCDGAHLRGATCASQTGHAGAGGTLKCNATCSGFDVSGCHFCGNGKRDPGEQCDGNDKPTCADVNGLGSTGMTTCDASCMLNTSMCTDCGNDDQEGDEQCDGTDIPGNCASLPGFTGGGPLLCRPDCTYDTTNCF